MREHGGSEVGYFPRSLKGLQARLAALASQPLNDLNSMMVVRQWCEKHRGRSAALQL